MSEVSSVTVVLDGPSATLEPAVAEFAQTLIFRPSRGFLSSPTLAAEEMRSELSERKIYSPIVLAAASFGGFAALTFARRFPENTAGLVLADASHPRQGERALATLAEVANTPEVEAFKKHLRGFGPVWEESCREMCADYSLGELPLIVLAAGAPEMPPELSVTVRNELTSGWHDLQRDYAARSTRGQLRIVAGVGHDLARLAPAEVLRAIREVVVITQISRSV